MIFYLLLSATCFFNARSKNDTIENWLAGFYTLDNMELSSNARWVAVKKRYDYNQDTIVIFDTQKPGVPVSQSALGGTISFLKKDGVLIFGKNRAEFQNLKSGKKIQYENVKAAYPLVEVGQYAILKNDSTLSVYASDGSMRHHLTDVQGLPITDNKRQLYVSRKNANAYEIINLSNNRTVILYTTDNEARRIELSGTGNQLIILENENGKRTANLTFINTQNGKVKHPDGIFPQNAEMSVTEIQNGKAYLINFAIRKKPEANPIVDIWYGNDSNLRSKKYGTIKYCYWVWIPERDKLTKIPNEEIPIIASVNSTRYFLSFHPTKGHNYTTLLPQLDTYLYDKDKKKHFPFAVLKSVNYGSPELFCSPDGRYLIGSENGKEWTLFELESLKKNIISRNGLRNPVYSSDSQFIFFESEDDVLRFDIKGNKLVALKIAPGKKTEIVNKGKSNLMEGFNFFLNTIDLQDPLLIKVSDKNRNHTSYMQVRNGIVDEVLTSTSNHVKELHFDYSLETFCAIEENYNLPTQLICWNVKRKKKKILYKSVDKKKSSLPIKMSIISYFNVAGKPLKGILYYPVNFQSRKKYPMVVRIYQVQSDSSNQFPIPGYTNPIGFDIRTLLQKGYFVYLPDILYEKSGTGLSALDCVNKALDAIIDNPNINKNKIGLIGHSHGGYETNFIATHSNRFAAYISGAGNSDIIRSYFSYNYNFHSPFYWQYENGQYEINIPFSENKQLYILNNPIYNVEKTTAPILLWAGKKDENIAWDQVMEFSIGLKRNRTPVIALFYPNQGHALGLNTAERKDLYRKVLEWWDYFLKDEKNIPWIDMQMKELISE